jgi:hypothetical protein
MSRTVDPHEDASPALREALRALGLLKGPPAEADRPWPKPSPGPKARPQPEQLSLGEDDQGLDSAT